VIVFLHGVEGSIQCDRFRLGLVVVEGWRRVFRPSSIFQGVSIRTKMVHVVRRTLDMVFKLGLRIHSRALADHVGFLARVARRSIHHAAEEPTENIVIEHIAAAIITDSPLRSPRS